MFLVCVRTVASDTVSSRAMSGPSRSLSRRRRTSSSRSLSGSISGWSLRGSALPVTRWRPGAGARSSRRSAASPRASAAPPSAAPRRRRRGRSPPAPPGRSRASSDARAAAASPAAWWASAWTTRMSMTLPVLPPVLGRCQQARAASSSASPMRVVGPVARPLCQEQPGERDVLELMQVGEVVGSRQAVLACPAPTPPAASPGRSSTRALMAATGRTFGEKSPTYRRSASPRSSSAPSRSPSALADPSHGDPRAIAGSAAGRSPRPAPGS